MTPITAAVAILWAGSLALLIALWCLERERHMALLIAAIIVSAVASAAVLWLMYRHAP